MARVKCFPGFLSNYFSKSSTSGQAIGVDSPGEWRKPYAPPTVPTDLKAQTLRVEHTYGLCIVSVYNCIYIYYIYTHVYMFVSSICIDTNMHTSTYIHRYTHTYVC